MKGLTKDQALAAVPSIQQAMREEPPAECNAWCDKCGEGIRFHPALLKFAKMGICDHGPKCGGTFKVRPHA